MKNIKWTDSLLESEIRKISADFGYFPSSKDLRQVKRHDLACKISKTGGFIHWSNRVNIPRKDSDSDFGWAGEESVVDLLKD